MSLLENHSQWISKEVIEVLNHNLNYSNWLDTYACEGKWKISIAQQNQQIEIYMPVSEWGKPHSGYWIVFSGRMELTPHLLLVWQNLEVPARLSYAEGDDDSVSLWIYGRQIVFEKVI